MGMPEPPQSGMNITPDGMIYEILDDGTIKQIGKVSPNGEFEPFRSQKDEIQVRNRIIYRIVNGKEQKIGRILPTGEIETISQRIQIEAEIAKSKVEIVKTVSFLIAFVVVICAAVYIFKSNPIREAAAELEAKKAAAELEAKKAAAELEAKREDVKLKMAQAEAEVKKAEAAAQAARAKYLTAQAKAQAAADNLKEAEAKLKLAKTEEERKAAEKSKKAAETAKTNADNTAAQLGADAKKAQEEAEAAKKAATSAAGSAQAAAENAEQSAKNAQAAAEQASIEKQRSFCRDLENISREDLVKCLQNKKLSCRDRADAYAALKQVEVEGKAGVLSAFKAECVKDGKIK